MNKNRVFTIATLKEKNIPISQKWDNPRGDIMIDLIKHFKDQGDMMNHDDELESKERLLNYLYEETEGFEYKIGDENVDLKEICDEMIDEMEKYCIQYGKPFGRGPKYKSIPKAPQ